MYPSASHTMHPSALRPCSRRLGAPKRVHSPGVLPGGQTLRLPPSFARGSARPYKPSNLLRENGAERSGGGKRRSAAMLASRRSRRRKRVDLEENRAHGDAAPVLLPALVEIGAGEQRHPIELLVVEDRERIAGDGFDAADSIAIALAPSLDDDLVAPVQRRQAGKGPGGSVRQGDVAGQPRVAGPRREGGPLQVTDLIPEPAHIPAGGLQGHADDRGGHAQGGDLQPQLSDVPIGEGETQLRDTTGWEARLRELVGQALEQRHRRVVRRS